MRPFAPLTLCLAIATAALAPTPATAQIVDPVVKDRLAPSSPSDPQNLWLLDLSDGGRVTIWLRPDAAPKMVERVKTLTRQHFYDGLTFHRVIDGFMAQGGDPKGDGTGGSTLANVPAEFNYLPHVRGAVSAARAEDENSANSQFFIVFQPTLKIDKKYTVFGRVIDGMAWVDKVERGEPPQNPTRIVHAYIAADNPPPYANMTPPAPTAVPATLPGGGTAAPKLLAPAKPAGKAAPRRR